MSAINFLSVLKSSTGVTKPEMHHWGKMKSENHLSCWKIKTTALSGSALCGLRNPITELYGSMMGSRGVNLFTFEFAMRFLLESCFYVQRSTTSVCKGLIHPLTRKNKLPLLMKKNTKKHTTFLDGGFTFYKPFLFTSIHFFFLLFYIEIPWKHNHFDRFEYFCTALLSWHWVSPCLLIVFEDFRQK